MCRLTDPVSENELFLKFLKFFCFPVAKPLSSPENHAAEGAERGTGTSKGGKKKPRLQAGGTEGTEGAQGKKSYR